MRAKTAVRAVYGTETTTISYSKHIILFGAFSSENLEIRQNAASLTYGDTYSPLTDDQPLCEFVAVVLKSQDPASDPLHP